MDSQWNPFTLSLAFDVGSDALVMASALLADLLQHQRLVAHNHPLLDVAVERLAFELPAHFVDHRVRLDVALEVHVRAFPDRLVLHVGAEGKTQPWNVCVRQRKKLPRQLNHCKTAGFYWS